MKVLIINTSENEGGAAIAASRLAEVLNRHGVEARLMVRDKHSQRPEVLTVASSRLRRWRLQLAFLWERLVVWLSNRTRKENLWAVDLGIGGAAVASTKAFREADIIHLHWVNQGFLSLSELRRILQSGKPVVWTMHDMWPCTAICHHARECTLFQSHCHDCPRLLYPSARDLSWRLFERKLKLYSRHRFTLVGCSQWIAGQARQSYLLAGQRIVSIPNTYNPRAFHPGSADEARIHYNLPRELRLLLFACQKVTNERKGLRFLLDALRSEKMQRWQGRLAVVVVGQMSEEVLMRVSFPLYPLNYIDSEEDMALLYQAVDLFVTPSLEENLPNTLMEAMACGTPCVGFDIGGVPEMIDHKTNGYVARYCDADDLADGISFVLDEKNHRALSTAAARKARTAWGEDLVAAGHIRLYNELLATGQGTDKRKTP